MVDRLRVIGGRAGLTPAQLALAWLLARAPWIVPIPGTTKLARLQENLRAASANVTSDDLDEVGRAVSETPVMGARYHGEPEDKARR